MAVVANAGRCPVTVGAGSLPPQIFFFPDPFTASLTLVNRCLSVNGAQPLQGWVQELQGCADDFIPAAWLGELLQCNGCHWPHPIHQRWADNQQAHGQHGRNGGPLVRLSAWVDALAVWVRL